MGYLKNKYLVTFVFALATSSAISAKVLNETNTSERSRNTEISTKNYDDFSERNLSNFLDFQMKYKLSIKSLFESLRINNPKEFLSQYKYLFYSGGDTALVENIICLLYTSRCV